MIETFKKNRKFLISYLLAARMAAHAEESPQPTPAPTGPTMTATQINVTPVLAPKMPHIHQVKASPMECIMKPEERFEASLETKTKQETEQKQKEEEDKNRPISCIPIAGSPW